MARPKAKVYRDTAGNVIDGPLPSYDAPIQRSPEVQSAMAERTRVKRRSDLSQSNRSNLSAAPPDPVMKGKGTAVAGKTTGAGLVSDVTPETAARTPPPVAPTTKGIAPLNQPAKEGQSSDILRTAQYAAPDAPSDPYGFDPDAGAWGRDNLAEAPTTPPLTTIDGQRVSIAESGTAPPPPLPPPPGAESPRIPESAAGLVGDPVTNALNEVATATGQDASGLPPDKLAPLAMNAMAQEEETTEEGERDFDAEWRNQMGDLLATHQDQYDDIMDLSYQEEAKMGRQAAAQAARLGYSAGGGGYGAAMAQAAMSGQEMRTRALLEHQQKGLDMRMGFLDKMFQRAQQEDDQEMQRWVQQEQDRTLKETTYIDAVLSAESETLEEATASGLIGQLGFGGKGEGEGGAGEGGAGDGGGEGGGKYDFGESYSPQQQSRMNEFAASSGLNAASIKQFDSKVSTAIKNYDDDAIYDWWDDNPDVSKSEVLFYVKQSADSSYEQFLAEGNDPNSDAAREMRWRLDDMIERIQDKEEGVTGRDFVSWLPFVSR